MIKSIGEHLQTRQLGIAKKTRGGINSAKADAVERLMREIMHEDPKDTTRFKYWLGRTRKLTSGQIHALIGSAKEGRKPAALFNYLLKNHGKKKAD